LYYEITIFKVFIPFCLGHSSWRSPILLRKTVSSTFTT
jgi:hypothetical protein